MDMKRVDILCFGGEDWWYHNRGHVDMQLMRRFAKMGTSIYVNSIVMQKPKVGEGKMFFKKLVRKTKSIFTGLKKSDAGFWIYSPFSLPVHHIGWLRPLNTAMLQAQLWFVKRKLRINRPILWVACPAACDVALKLKKHSLIYQRTDRFEEYPNVDATVVSKYDRRLKAEADLTVFANRLLYKEEAKNCKKAIYLDHGVDYKLFAAAENRKEIPIDLKNIKRPIVGFFGGIDEHTSDIALLQRVVDLLPHTSFVFVGKASADITNLNKRKNVWFLGQKPYEQIPHYGKCFDVAIMPWRQNHWIEACNPIKLKEYLALGKPIVSTPFPELKKYLDVVYVAKTSEEFARCIETALKEDNPERVIARRKKVQQETWDSKAEFVLENLFDEPSILTGEVTGKPNSKKLKVCLAASAGGHLSQLLKIVENWNKHDIFWVTTSDVVKKRLREQGSVYIVGESNREHPVRVLKVLARCVKIVLREKPDVIISTGASVGCIICFLGKLTRAKVVWIDSITNTQKLSLSGRLVRYIADLFLVQWAELTKQYNNVEYVGALI